MRQWFLGLALTLSTPALADGPVDWNLSPAKAELGDWTATIGGLAGGSIFSVSGFNPGQGANLSLLAYPRIERTLENGWVIGARGAILAYHDRLAGDVYGNRTFEKGYAFAQTPYGRLEVGQVDGMGYRLAITGPSVDDAIAIDNASTTFFRDPATGRAFIDQFRIQTAELASSNSAKFNYLSPEWFGVQVGISYTPYDAHGGLPFVSHGAGGDDQQRNILDGALNFSSYEGSLAYGLYAAVAIGHNAMPTPGHDDLRDWSLGGEATYPLDDDIKLALGAAWRRSNAYAFDIGDVRASGETDAWHVSTTLTNGPWIVGFEYAKGNTDNAVTRPALDQFGYEASVGYVLNTNLQLTLGWQGLHFRRDPGVFVNGSSTADMNAAFLHLRFHV